MRVHGHHYRALAWQGGINGELQWIDQCLLPHRFSIKTSRNPEAIARAIEIMQVRGAPTIGAMASFGLALAYIDDRKNFESHWLSRFQQTRPTAVNLFHACHAMQKEAVNDPSTTTMLEAAIAYADTEVECNRNIGMHLAELLAVGERRILTHCNAGWLAAVDWGTALSGIYQLARNGESPSVLADETRPRLQGARLTAWELQQEGIDCHVQADSAAAWMMASGKVDAVVVGADRIAANGDVANKIGTYMLSLAAREHGIPFYVAAPASTFDSACASGRNIPIEYRDETEIQWVDGVDQEGVHHHVAISAASHAHNPAFDVTPAANITAIISESGTLKSV
ncbi:MAG: S-methyl-5-thioribose-1-phosphate isomerase [Mariprofundaceae bacterium]